MSLQIINKISIFLIKKIQQTNNHWTSEIHFIEYIETRFHANKLGELLPIVRHEAGQPALHCIYVKNRYFAYLKESSIVCLYQETESVGIQNFEVL